MQGKDFAEIPDSAFERLQELLARFAVIQVANRENFSNCLPEKTMDFLDREGIFQAWERFEKNQGKKGADCQKFLREWFDGLKTLRFLHFFQKNS